jgi:cytidyltransferase-like protein
MIVCKIGGKMDKNNWIKNVIIVSGGFDPVHKGHLRMFREASQLGHQVIVGLNSDDWLTRKKGKPFMGFDERKEIIEGFKYVNQVLSFDDKDDTASDLIKRVYQIFDGEIYFGNGGDRGKGNVPETDVCKKLGVEMIWGLGGGKIQSSSDLIKKSLTYIL